MTLRAIVGVPADHIPMPLPWLFSMTFVGDHGAREAADLDAAPFVAAGVVAMRLWWTFAEEKPT
jgi:hypothetical protein